MQRFNTNFNVNLKTGQFNCFACCASGNYIKFRAMSDRINTKEATIGSILDREVLEENLRINCIPQGFSKMSIENFDDFLKQRRILMAQKIKEYYYSL